MDFNELKELIDRYEKEAFESDEAYECLKAYVGEHLIRYI